MNQVEHQELIVSQLYPNLCTHVVTRPVLGETKRSRRRRRKNNKGEGNGRGEKKRKLTEQQVNMLEISFDNDHKLESERKHKLAMELGLHPRQVAVWFQNKRARWKNKKLEEEYSKLKKAHETVIVEKCHLETEVMKLKEQLFEAENKLHKLCEHLDGMISAGSPNSSLSINRNQQESGGEFVVGGLDNLWGVPDFNNIDGMGWDFCGW